MKNSNKKWVFVIILLAILFFIGFIFSGIISLFVSDEAEPFGNVALIPINGFITSSEGDNLFGESFAASDSVIDNIRKADKNHEIKAIILEINSGGGMPVASEEIVNAVKNTNKTIVALIRDVGASGAYWIASATDHIFASRMSITGSVGVIASYLQFSGLLEHYNVTYERLVAGEYKDIGTPFKEPSSVERALLQEQLDSLHDYFLDDVVQNRNLTEEQKSRIATGQFFIGLQSKELNLIDEFGGIDEAAAYVENIIGESAVLAEYKEKKTILDIFGLAMNKRSFFVGKGIGSALVNAKQTSTIEVLT